MIVVNDVISSVVIIITSIISIGITSIVTTVLVVV